MGIEADSLNAAVLGPDVSVGDEIWHTFIRNVVKDMTQKTGQKCTAIRRVMVPEAIADSVAEALSEELARIKWATLRTVRWTWGLSQRPSS